MAINNHNQKRLRKCAVCSINNQNRENIEKFISRNNVEYCNTCYVLGQSYDKDEYHNKNLGVPNIKKYLIFDQLKFYQINSKDRIVSISYEKPLKDITSLAKYAKQKDWPKNKTLSHFMYLIELEKSWLEINEKIDIDLKEKQGLILELASAAKLITLTGTIKKK